MKIQILVGCVLIAAGVLMVMLTSALREKPNAVQKIIEQKPKIAERRAVIIIENENSKAGSPAHVITENSIWHWPVKGVRHVQIDAIYGDRMQKFYTKVPQDFEVRFSDAENQEIAIIGKFCGFLLRADGSGYGWGRYDFDTSE